jgi:hypothetical protein
VDPSPHGGQLRIGLYLEIDVPPGGAALQLAHVPRAILTREGFAHGSYATLRLPIVPASSRFRRAMNCHACGTPLSAGARFCHKCGASTTPPPPATASWRAGIPWGIAGLALGALIAVVTLRGSGGAPGSSPAAPFAGRAPAAMPASDISQMSPEEQAQRLFDRVMRLQEEGKTDSVQFFLPMAIGAYQQLPAQTLDAHFDMGLLLLAGGDPSGALAEADSIRRRVPTHLYADVLRARAALARNDERTARQAFQNFLKNEAAERARRRPEYDEHPRILDAFHAEAVSRTAN